MLILAFDVVNQAFVPNYNGSASALPQFRQGKYKIRIYPVEPVTNSLPGSPNNTGNFQGFTDAKIVAEGYQGIRFGIWSSSTGTLGDEDTNVLALTDQTGWTYNNTDPANPYWEGTFNTYTAELANFIGSASSKPAYFAINWVIGADLYPIFDQKNGANITLLSASDGGGGVPEDMTQNPPIIWLPCQLGVRVPGGPDRIYDIREIAPGNIQFVQQ